MQTYLCQCGNRLFFENNGCVQCQSETGFLPDQLLLVSIVSQDGIFWTSEQAPQQRYRKCQNFMTHHVCNWMIPENETDEEFCISCRLNKIIPDLTQPANLRRWYRMERAKRRTLYNLFRIGLHVTDRKSDPARGLAFQFMDDVREYDPFTHEMVRYEQIMTGHDTGTITINIQEADHSHREAVRENMNEPYRTPLGHMRHEVGHFFWDKLIAGSTSSLERFRALFGDERADYQQSLQQYYQTGPVQNWAERFISAYASAHAWEDWAETWAHYLHITDTMETANDFAISIEGRALLAPLSGDSGNGVTPPKHLTAAGFDEMLTDWMRLTITLNALNRSMGQRDAYPFAVSTGVGDKLRFVHQVIADEVARQEQAEPLLRDKQSYV